MYSLADAFFPNKTLGFLPFFFTVLPLTFAVSAGIGFWLGLKAWRKGKVS
jgi:hypothetical protein